MATYDKIAVKIIKEQEQLIGSVAWQEASKVSGLKIINEKNGEVSIEENKDGRLVIDDLISKYGNMFGRAARQVCKEAVTSLVADLSPSEVPSSLA